ncbi:thiamine biosynthesis protein ThiS [bacterium B17]|nr:thiamine biosynthesis protein ThiS [bacterium B17]
MKIVLNGKDYEYNASNKLTALLDELKIDSQCVAVMINDSIVSRDKRDSTSLDEGDCVEIVTCAPGG